MDAQQLLKNIQWNLSELRTLPINFKEYIPDFVARNGVRFILAAVADEEDSFPLTVVADMVVESLLELLAPGENLDLVLVLTVSQPPSSSWVRVFKFSTDLGVLSPLTVSAQDLLELDELIDEVDPKGGGTPLIVLTISPASFSTGGTTLEVTTEAGVEAPVVLLLALLLLLLAFDEDRPRPGKFGVVEDRVNVRCWLELLTLAANLVCLWTSDTRSFLAFATFFFKKIHTSVFKVLTKA